MSFITRGLSGGGTTAHYQFQYDDSLERTAAKPSLPEPARTNSAIAACENDFNLMASWFGGIALDVTSIITVNITQNSGGAAWGLKSGQLTVTVNPSVTGTASFVRYLMVSEMVEQFMRAQKAGWFGTGTEGSEGEGLSRFLAAQFLALNGLGNTPAGFTNSNLWMQTDRIDFVNTIALGDDGPDAKSGCSLLFIYYLFAQLGFSLKDIVAAGAPTLGGVYKNLTRDSSNPFPVFKRLLDHYFPGKTTISGPNPDNPFPLNDLIRGVLLAGKFRTFQELKTMSADDRRNTLIVVLHGLSNQSIAHFQGMDNITLAGAGAVLVFLRLNQTRTDAQLKTMSDDDQRNTMIVVLQHHFNLPASQFQSHKSIELVEVILGNDLATKGIVPGQVSSYIGGVLLAGKFRTLAELEKMSPDDQRNTLIVVLNGLSNQSVSHYQGFNNAQLEGKGAVLVFLREAKIRADADLKKMNDDDKRNTLIVEMAAQTGLAGGVLQGMTDLDLALLGLGVG